MRNKMIALLLCGSMVLASLAGCGGDSQDDKGKENDVSKVEEGQEQPEDSGEEEQAGSEEKISFSMTGVNTSAGVDYLSGAVGQYIMDEFNVDFEIQPNGWDGSGERFSIAATSGELADLNVWLDFSWGAYYEYVNQGLFAPLPDNWKERWPNLSRMVEKTGYMESLDVDGKTYGILHATFGNLTEVDVATNHWALYLRKDLAEQVGMNDLCADNTITLSELKEYLQKVKEAGLIDNAVIGSGSSE